MSFLSADDLRKLASETAVAGDSLDDYATAHQKVMDVAQQVPIASAFVPLVNAIWEPITGKAGTSAEQKKRDQEVAQKKAASEKAYVPDDVKNAQAVAKSLSRAAEDADEKAAAAAAKAATESDPNGPLHQAARRAHNFAVLQRASADQALARAAAAQGIPWPPKTIAPPPPPKRSSPWRNIAIVGGVVLGAGAVFVLLTRRKRK
jgi:hypothetical protein